MAGKTAGRRAKLNRDLETRLCQLLEAGVPSSVAYPGAGISRETASDYRRRARLGEPRYVEFAQKIEVAIAKGRVSLLLQVRKHGGKDFRAPAWILNNAHSDEFGPKSKVEVSIEQEAAKLLETAKKALSPDAYAKLLEAYIGAENTARDGGSGTGEDS